MTVFVVVFILSLLINRIMSAMMRITLFQMLYSVMSMILCIIVFSCVCTRLMDVDVSVGHSSVSSTVVSILSLLTDGHSSSGFESHGGPCPQSCSFGI